MGVQKSRSLVREYQALVCDIIREDPLHTPPLSVIRDVATVRARVDKEGMPFLTVLFHSFGKPFRQDSSLSAFKSPYTLNPQRSVISDQRFFMNTLRGYSGRMVSSCQ